VSSPNRSMCRLICTNDKIKWCYAYHVFHEFLFAFMYSVVLIKNIYFLCFLSYIICACLCIVMSYTHCVVYFFIVLFVFVLCLVYLMLPVSLDCPLLIAPSVFSNVYILYVTVWIYYVNNRENIFIFYNSYRIHASYCVITIKYPWNK
jgi:hypothetical protein